MSENGTSAASWEPTGWWRALLPDGTPRAEARDEAEVRDLARERVGTVVQQHVRRVEEMWLTVPNTPSSTDREANRG